MIQGLQVAMKSSTQAPTRSSAVRGSIDFAIDTVSAAREFLAGPKPSLPQNHGHTDLETHVLLPCRSLSFLASPRLPRQDGVSDVDISYPPSAPRVQDLPALSR